MYAEVFMRLSFYYPVYYSIQDLRFLEKNKPNAKFIPKKRKRKGVKKNAK